MSVSNLIQYKKADEGNINFLERVLFSYPKKRLPYDSSDLEVFTTDENKVCVSFETLCLFESLKDLKGYYEKLLKQFSKYMKDIGCKVICDEYQSVHEYHIKIHEEHMMNDDKSTNSIYYSVNIEEEEILADNLISAFIEFEKLLNCISSEIDSYDIKRNRGIKGQKTPIKTSNLILFPNPIRS